MLLSIVIPAYNEESTIDRLLNAVLEAPLPEGIERELVVVDDGSSDRTIEKVQAFAEDGRVRLVQQPENRGKGAALRRGFAPPVRDPAGRFRVGPGAK